MYRAYLLVTTQLRRSLQKPKSVPNQDVNYLKFLCRPNLCAKLCQSSARATRTTLELGPGSYARKPTRDKYNRYSSPSSSLMLFYFSGSSQIPPIPDTHADVLNATSRLENLRVDAALQNTTTKSPLYPAQGHC